MECCEVNKDLNNSCGHGSSKFDYVLWVSFVLVAVGYISELFSFTSIISVKWFSIYADAAYSLMNTMWWGLALGVLFVAVFSKIPRELVISALGHKKGIRGLLRATALGLLLDLCNHGILLVGMKLYERGASLGQTMAFLIASPWNSLSLTVILVSLVGWEWTLIFILLSALVALSSGLIFDFLVEKGSVPRNENRLALSEDFSFTKELKAFTSSTKFSINGSFKMLREGLSESTMILKWIFVGVVLTGLIRAFVPVEIFQNYFGPSLLGLGVTLIAATVIEICSEGSVPIAADILSRAAAPGNAFTFLMAGVATDYTEIMAVKETTKSWKIALFLPLITVPQVIILGYILNNV